MYADYLREKSNDQIIENEHGFASYRYLNDGKSVYIIDIYILSSARKHGSASAMADLIVGEAKKIGCSELLGTVVPSSKNSTDSLRVLLGYGMSLYSSSQDLILFRKDI
jgi:predicted GNAT family acetyltransferase